MNAPSTTRSTGRPLRASRSLATATSTVQSALSWVGHSCPSHCSADIDDLHANVWFIRTTRRDRAASQHTLIVVDLSDSSAAPLTEIRRAIRNVNTCTHADGIDVRQRRAGDHGRALAALNLQQDAHQWFHYYRPDERAALPAEAEGPPTSRDSEALLARGSHAPTAQPTGVTMPLKLIDGRTRRP